ncbi:hypothetical protein KBD18_01540 [Patescibacteria group bacterium]|nr:hypothetical protein [Patescibacteria group bacterium]
MKERGGLQRTERLPQVEQPEQGFDSPESSGGQAVEKREPARGDSVGESPALSVPLPIAPAQQRTKDPVLKQVEEILEEDLGETYNSLPPELRAKFKEQGEVVATSIQRMIGGAKVHAKKVLQLVVTWLRIIPHINRFFLEQEAKIKTDRIIALGEREKQKHL